MLELDELLLEELEEEDGPPGEPMEPTEASTAPEDDALLLAELLELEFPPLVPPADEAEPIWAEVQAAHAKNTINEGVHRLSHCIGTPPKAAAEPAALFTHILLRNASGWKMLSARRCCTEF
jgi:hypothetical protein